MAKDRLSIILPVATAAEFDNVKGESTHMQILRNDKTKHYELRFWDNEGKLLGKKRYHNMTINVMSDNDNNLSMHFAEAEQKSDLSLLFEKRHDVVSIKKYVDTLLI